jgi:hypothetical protein
MAAAAAAAAAYPSLTAAHNPQFFSAQVTLYNVPYKKC